MGLRDRLNCMQSIAQPITPMSIAACQASGTGRFSVHVAPWQDSQRLSMAKYAIGTATEIQPPSGILTQS